MPRIGDPLSLAGHVNRTAVARLRSAGIEGRRVVLARARTARARRHAAGDDASKKHNSNEFFMHRPPLSEGNTIPERGCVCCAWSIHANFIAWPVPQAPRQDRSQHPMVSRQATEPRPARGLRTRPGARSTGRSARRRSAQSPIADSRGQPSVRPPAPRPAFPVRAISLRPFPAPSRTFARPWASAAARPSRCSPSHRESRIAGVAAPHPGTIGSILRMDHRTDAEPHRLGKAGTSRAPIETAHGRCPEQVLPPSPMRAYLGGRPRRGPGRAARQGPVEQEETRR